MTATNLDAVIRDLIRRGDLDSMEERLILSDALIEAGRDEEASGLRNEANEEFWLAGERLCWGNPSDWMLIFRSGDAVYVTGADNLDWFQARDLFGHGARRSTGVCLDDTSAERFYMMALADCFDPPVAIVRASGDSDAVDAFCDELTWSHINEANIVDYDTDGTHDGLNVYWNSSGQPCDIEALVMHDVKLVGAIRK